MKQLALDFGTAPEATFESYLPGVNLHALQHLRAWLAVGSSRAGECIYLWGPSGCGKTHLLRAACNALLAQGAACGWLDAAAPLNMPFDDEWGAAFLDDVHAYDATRQHVAFTWFVNAAAPDDGAPRPILAAGREPPAALPLREDLRTRLAWGHVFELQPLDENGARCALQRAAHARGLHMPEALANYLLTRFARDMGSLMALLDRLDRYAWQEGRAITVPLLRKMLQHELPE